MEKISNFLFSKSEFTLERGLIEHPSQGIILVSGSSGAGKTSFMRSLAGLENDYVEFNWTLSFEEVGFHFQDIKLFSGLTVEENLRLISNDLSSIDSLLERLELTEKKKSLAGSLSGGEAQRVGFIRAVLKKPKLLFLDEPFGQVNLNIRNKMYSVLREYLRKDTLVFVSTHIGDELKHDFEIKIF